MRQTASEIRGPISNNSRCDRPAKERMHRGHFLKGAFAMVRALCSKGARAAASYTRADCRCSHRAVRNSGTDRFYPKNQWLAVPAHASVDRVWKADFMFSRVAKTSGA